MKLKHKHLDIRATIGAILYFTAVAIKYIYILQDYIALKILYAH